MAGAVRLGGEGAEEGEVHELEAGVPRERQGRWFRRGQEGSGVPDEQRQGPQEAEEEGPPAASQLLYSARVAKPDSTKVTGLAGDGAGSLLASALTTPTVAVVFGLF